MKALFCESSKFDFLLFVKAGSMNTWNGLVVIICSHWDLRLYSERRKLLLLMLDSIKVNTLLPETVIISYSSDKDNTPPIGLHSFPFAVKWCYRKKMSQMCHLLTTVNSITTQYMYALLVDDDDLIAPSLIEEYRTLWKHHNYPEQFFFKVSYIRNCKISDATATEWNPKWIQQSNLPDYGGSIVTISTLKCI